MIENPKPAPLTANIVAATGRKRSERRTEAEAAERRRVWRRACFHAEWMRQQANRYQMALDEAYYDGDQWLPSERRVIEARGQAPVVFNECKPLVDFLIGTERRARVDSTVQNRSDPSPEAWEDANAKQALLKFIDDLNATQFARSDAAAEVFKAGLSWLELGVRADPDDYPIYVRHESWRNMLYDSLGSSKVCEDWRYIFRFREVDFDIAEAMLEDRSKVDLLRRSIITADARSTAMDWLPGGSLTDMTNAVSGVGKWRSYDPDAWLSNPRERVLLIESWTTEPYRDTTGAGAGVHDRVRMRKRVSIMTEQDTLFESWSPYAHNEFPFIPIWCYRRAGDGAPYGVIRQQRGPQDALNKHMSKAQFRLAARQVWKEDGALDESVMDEHEFEEAVGDPTSVITVARNALSGGKIEIKEAPALAAADIQLAERYAQSIRATGGVSVEDRGQEPGGDSVSGKARAIRQEQGSRLVAEIFDNLLRARQLEGEIKLSLAEQYHTEPMTFPRASDGRPEYVSINQPGPDGVVLNDITQRKAAFVIGEAPWQQSLAEAAFESAMAMMGELAKVAPNVVVAILDVVFEMHPSLPKKALLLRRIRAATGAEDPSQGETPEQQQRKAQQAQMAEAQFNAQLAELQATVAEAKARGEKLEAEALSKRLEALYMSAQAAQVLTMAPEIAPVADELAASVGFRDQAGQPFLGQPVPTQQQQTAPIPPAQQADGALAGGMAGAESPAITGVRQPPTQGA